MQGNPRISRKTFHQTSAKDSKDKTFVSMIDSYYRKHRQTKRKALGLVFTALEWSVAQQKDLESRFKSRKNLPLNLTVEISSKTG